MTNDTSNTDTYDAAGNMTGDGFHSYSYDAEGNIVAVDGGQTASYVYDALHHKARANDVGYGQTVEHSFDVAGRVSSDYWLQRSLPPQTPDISFGTTRIWPSAAATDTPISPIRTGSALTACIPI